MVINYIVLAHKEPRQLLRLVKRLETEHTFFYIHIDKKVEAAPFHELLQNKQNVLFLPPEKRVRSAWGSMGVIRATLSAMREVANDNRRGYTILVSGQCYPLKSNNYIYSYLRSNYGINFIEGFKLPNPVWACTEIRLKHYAFFTSSEQRSVLTAPPFRDFLRRPQKWKNTLKNYGKILFYHPRSFWRLTKQRNWPLKLPPYGGMAYWALPIESIHFILQFLSETPSYIHYHEHTLFPDEIFFQTIVHNFFSKVSDPITFACWPVPGVYSPQTFTADQFNILKQRKELFARKFDYSVDTKILDMIDQELLEIHTTIKQ